MKETLGNFCPVIISDDEGKSFSEPICTAYLGENQRCYDPVLWIDPMNRLWFIWNEVPAFCVYASICEKPDEEKLNWSEPFFIGKLSSHISPKVGALSFILSILFTLKIRLKSKKILDTS